MAGGTSLLLSPIGTVNLTKAGFCAPDGRVRAFDAAASGYVRSEGAGLVVLKPLSAALQNQDPIYAVIRGSAVNQNGTSNGLTAPSRAAQEQVLREAYAAGQRLAGPGPVCRDPGHRHAAGRRHRSLGPGQRAAAGPAAGQPLRHRLGEDQLGHLEAAAGVASLMKAALALQHRQLPPNLHFRTPNPDIPFDQLPLRGAAATGTLADVGTARDWRASAPSASAAATPTWCWRKLRRRPPLPRQRAVIPTATSLPLVGPHGTALQALAERYVEFLARRSAGLVATCATRPPSAGTITTAGWPCWPTRSGQALLDALRRFPAPASRGPESGPAANRTDAA